MRPQLKAEVQNVDTLNRKLSALEELLSQSQAEARSAPALLACRASRMHSVSTARVRVRAGYAKMRALLMGWCDAPTCRGPPGPFEAL